MWTKAHTYWRLGVFNVARVFAYRLKCRFGYFKRVMPGLDWHESGPCFPSAAAAQAKREVLSEQVDRSIANRLLLKHFCYFFHAWFDLSEQSPWLYNPYTQKTWQRVDRHWSELGYFAKAGEDVKAIWEQSRFYWAPQLALAYRASGKQAYLGRLNELVLDWRKNNKPFDGYQWLCAQETSIRLINLLLADYLLALSEPSSVLIELVKTHVARILPTLSYAIAQQNNHATSEAAALYLAGQWLIFRVGDNQAGERLVLKGKHLLETHVEKLVADDGSFAQYSATYHRLMLDGLSLCIYFQRLNDTNPFSRAFLQRYEKATQWLQLMVSAGGGGAPNWGSNDGALLFKLDEKNYRDFNSTLNLAHGLLSGSKQSLLALLLESVKQEGFSGVNHLAKSGLVALNNECYSLLFRYPYFKFRPGQCDLMHVDLWVNGVNVLIDSGSYSYNPKDKKDSLKATANHNTVQVDGFEQMPSLSRFLYGAWPQSKLRTGDGFVEASFRSYFNYQHTRRINYHTDQIEIIDQVVGAKKEITLCWHLGDLDWRAKDNEIHSELVTIEFFAGGQAAQIALSQAKHSLYYGEARTHQVVKLTVAPGNAPLRTIISIN